MGRPKEMLVFGEIAVGWPHCVKHRWCVLIVTWTEIHCSSAAEGLT